MITQLIKIIKSRLFTFVFTFSFWVATVTLLFNIGILKDADPTIVLLIHLGAFFFALTTSPTTWIIKGLGIEIGSNTPSHFQADKIVEEGKTSVIVRDYSTAHDQKKINEILSEQTRK